MKLFRISWIVKEAVVSIMHISYSSPANFIFLVRASPKDSQSPALKLPKMPGGKWRPLSPRQDRSVDKLEGQYSRLLVSRACYEIRQKKGFSSFMVFIFGGDRTT